jgi:hypothetical protein
MTIYGKLYGDESFVRRYYSQSWLRFYPGKTNVHYCVQNGHLLGHILSEMNPMHIVKQYLRSV